MGTLVPCPPLLLGLDYPHGVGEESCSPISSRATSTPRSALLPIGISEDRTQRPSSWVSLESWLHGAGHRASHLSPSDEGASLGSSRQFPRFSGLCVL